MTEERCEPPPELRGVDGWHWVQPHQWAAIPARWHAAPHDGLEPLWASTHHVASGTPAWAADEWGWRYLAPVATPEEVAALRAEVARAGAVCADMGAEIVRLRAEVASMRVTLGQQPPAEGAEPIGCPLPGMCSMVAATSTLRARVAELEDALRCADQFITNGIELGYIRMPSPGTPDAAHRTPGIVRAALEGKP